MGGISHFDTPNSLESFLWCSAFVVEGRIQKQTLRLCGSRVGRRRRSANTLLMTEHENSAAQSLIQRRGAILAPRTHVLCFEILSCPSASSGCRALANGILDRAVFPYMRATAFGNVHKDVPAEPGVHAIRAWEESAELLCCLANRIANRIRAADTDELEDALPVSELHNAAATLEAPAAASSALERIWNDVFREFCARVESWLAYGRECTQVADFFRACSSCLEPDKQGEVSEGGSQPATLVSPACATTIIEASLALRRLSSHARFNGKDNDERSAKVMWDSNTQMSWERVKLSSISETHRAFDSFAVSLEQGMFRQISEVVPATSWSANLLSLRQIVLLGNEMLWKQTFAPIEDVLKGYDGREKSCLHILNDCLSSAVESAGVSWTSTEAANLYPINYQLKMDDSAALSIRVRPMFPVDIVLEPHLEDYERLFAVSARVRRTGLALERCFSEHITGTRRSRPELGTNGGPDSFHGFLHLRMLMSHFLMSVDAYLQVDVFEPAYVKLRGFLAEQALSAGDHVDVFLLRRAHDACMRRMLDGSMVSLTNYCRRLFEICSICDQACTLAPRCAQYDETASESVSNLAKLFKTNVTLFLRIVVASGTSTTHGSTAGLVARINYNGYYMLRDRELRR